MYLAVSLPLLDCMGRIYLRETADVLSSHRLVKVRILAGPLDKMVSEVACRANLIRVLVLRSHPTACGLALPCLDN